MLGLQYSRISLQLVSLDYREVSFCMTSLEIILRTNACSAQSRAVARNDRFGPGPKTAEELFRIASTPVPKRVPQMTEFFAGFDSELKVWCFFIKFLYSRRSSENRTTKSKIR